MQSEEYLPVLCVNNIDMILFIFQILILHIVYVYFYESDQVIFISFTLSKIPPKLNTIIIQFSS